MVDNRRRARHSYGMGIIILLFLAVFVVAAIAGVTVAIVAYFNKKHGS